MGKRRARQGTRRVWVMHSEMFRGCTCSSSRCKPAVIRWQFLWEQISSGPVTRCLVNCTVLRLSTTPAIYPVHLESPGPGWCLRCCGRCMCLMNTPCSVRLCARPWDQPALSQPSQHLLQSTQLLPIQRPFRSGSSPLLATRCRQWLEAIRTGDPGGLRAAPCVPAKPGCLAGHWKERSTSGAWCCPADVKIYNFHKETVESDFLLKTTASIYYLCSSI